MKIRVAKDQEKCIRALAEMGQMSHTEAASLLIEAGLGFFICMGGPSPAEKLQMASEVMSQHSWGRAVLWAKTTWNLGKDKGLVNE